MRIGEESPSLWLLITCALWAPAVAHLNTRANEPLIECDRSMLAKARQRIAAEQEPFHTYWQLAQDDIKEAMELKPAPYAGSHSLDFHGAVQQHGIAARLLAYKWRLEDDTAAGERAVLLIDAWASASPLPGTKFDSKIRFANSGMDVARGLLPMVAAYDLLCDHPTLTPKRQERIEAWFWALADVVKEGARRWEVNDDFGDQEFQNHHAAHVLGLVLLGAVLHDDELIQYAVDSPDNPKDFKEIVAGLILLPGDAPHGGLRNKPLHAGELQDRHRTNEGAGLTYCHLSMTLLLYTAEVLTRVKGDDYLNWKAEGGECLRLPTTFYSDFFRLRDARINGDYYFRDHRNIQNNQPYLGIFEVALHHWPDVPNLRAVVRSTDRARVPRSWLCYYALPLLTHGVDKP